MLLTLFRCGKSFKYPFRRRLGGFRCLSGCRGKYLPLTGLKLALLNDKPSPYNEWATGNYWPTITFTNDIKLNATHSNQYCLCAACYTCAALALILWSWFRRAPQGRIAWNLWSRAIQSTANRPELLALPLRISTFRSIFTISRDRITAFRNTKLHTNVTMSPCHRLALRVMVIILNECCRRLIAVRLRLDSLFSFTVHYSRVLGKAQV